MKLRLVTAIAFSAMAIMSCNEEILEIGTSITNDVDKVEVSTGIFNATSRSVLADSVYARNFDCYFGNIKDPETGAYVKSEFMAQFNMVEDKSMPAKDKIQSNVEGEIAADSCQILFYFNDSKCYGDTLMPVKINVLEMNKPMSDTKIYYSNYDPKKEGYIRVDGLKKNTALSIEYNGGLVEINLNDPYTDKDGRTYSNYGTYFLESYYAHPEYFKNSYSFTHSVCPGFYFEVDDCLGVMANLSEIDMRVYYHYLNKNDSVQSTYFEVSSTPEVLQTNRIINDMESLQKLVDDNSCTYLKTPAGIFTEVTLPVDEIREVHATDSLLSVAIDFQRLNSGVKDNDYMINSPTNILMVMKDSLYTFFEKRQLMDNTTSYISSLSTVNCYSFSNIGNLITQMAKLKANGLKSDSEWTAKHPDWNKVVLVPVATSTTSDSYGNTTISAVSNQMALSSTKLKGGPNGNKIEMKVVYAKYNDKTD